MKKRLFILLTVLASLFYWGCAGSKMVERPVSPEVAVKPSPPPEGELKEIVVSQLEERKEPEEFFSLSLRDEDIRDVLLAFVNRTDYNIVVDPDVSGKVTVDLKNVTLNQAFDALLSPLDLEYKRGDDFIRVSKSKMETRVFYFQYITTTRTGTGTISASTRGGGGGGVNSVTSSETADPWQDLEAGLSKIISKEGYIVINKMAGCVLITDFPFKLKLIAQFLDEIESSIIKQVKIEAMIVDIVLSKDHQTGINLNSIFQLSDLKILNLKPTESLSATMNQALSSATGVFQIGVSNQSFSALLDAMSQEGKVNIISNPQVSVMNNQMSIIKATTTDVFWEVTTTYDPETKKSTTLPVARTVDVGVVLSVTPQISPDGEVTMHIHPSITEKIGESTFESQTTKGTVPILSERETDTVIKVRDGKTVIIAGLIQDKKNTYITKVPILGNIPVLGALFRLTKNENIKTELAIFLTPTVIVGTRLEDLSREELKKLEINPNIP